MRRVLLGVLVTGAVAAALPAGVASQSATDVHRVVYVTATTDDDVYVPDLTVEDLKIEEGGRERQIVDVSRSTARLKIALAVDELLAPYRVVRQAAWDFVQRLNVYADMSLYLMGRRNELLVDYTSDVTPFWNAINAFPVRPNYPGSVVESLHEIAQAQRSVEGRRVIIALAPEMAQLSNVTADAVLDDLRETGAILYTVTIMSTGDAPPTLEQAPATRLEGGDLTAQIERDRVLGNGPKQSGGLRLSSMNVESFPGALGRIADDLLHEYAVTYLVPAGTRSNGNLKIEAERDDLDVRGPSRLPEL